MPTRTITETVKNNTIAMNFAEGVVRNRSAHRLPWQVRRLVQSTLYRELQDKECLDERELKVVEKTLEVHSQKVYDERLGIGAISNLIITVQDDYDDLSGGDCTKIELVFTQQLDFIVGGGDETTIAEVIALPMKSSADRNAFKQNLIDNSADESKFSTLGEVEEITVNEVNLSTRSPSARPSTSTAPTVFPSATPTG